MKATGRGVVMFAMLVTAMALDCKMCMHMTTEDPSFNAIIDDVMERTQDSPIQYTTDCRDNTRNVQSSSCPINSGCMAVKMSYLLPVGGGDRKLNVDQVLRMCGSGLDNHDNGCHDVHDYEDLREIIHTVPDMTGTVCFCEDENCNVENDEALTVGGD